MLLLPLIRMKNKVFFSLLLILLSGNFLCAQQKFEKEYRLKTSAVPELARQFVDSLGFDRRVKWYMEISELGKTVEAKSRLKRRHYSVEFDSAGRFLDIEIEISFEEIPQDIKEVIAKKLKEQFDTYRIIKVQEQLTGTKENVRSYLIDSKSVPLDKLVTKYEILVKGSKNRVVNEYEIIFSKKGIIEKKSEIIFRNTDNLEY